MNSIIPWILVGSVAARCWLETGDNIFMAWNDDPSVFRSFHLAALESALFQYPSANLVIVEIGLERSAISVALNSVKSRGYCVSLMRAPEYTSSFLDMQVFVYQLQVQFGGLYIPFDGALLNTLEYVTERDRPIFMETVNHQLPDLGFTVEDFENFTWKRPHTDVSPNISYACALACLRYLPKNSRIGHALLQSISSGAHPDILLTNLIRRTEVSEVLILPSWLVVESKFPDMWSESSIESSFTDLYAPRQGRYRYDHWYVMSHKLWMPFFSPNKQEEMNVVDFSVVALVRKELSLNLFTKPFSPLFSPNSETLLIKSPLNRIERLMTPEQLALRQHFHVRDAGLPGPMGGYRTFQQLRFLGNDENKLLLVKITLDPPVVIFCRSETCKTVGSIQKSNTYSACGSEAIVNAAVAGLAYRGVSLESGFTTISVSLFSTPTCASGEITLLESTNFTALATDAEQSVTVVAHSGGRCDLLGRLERSLRARYGEVSLLVTCETEEGDDEILEPVRNDEKSNLFTTWYDVPNDYGLSRGKSFLISRVDTEFVLVLDDDFTFGFASCLECLVMKMKSKLHSAVLPLDIVGFPVLEDERTFGAFRGSLKLADSRLALEPYTHSSSPDGCMRVDICPMVFLGRTDRVAKFSWEPDLPLGEHELFFYANKLNGAQVAVCADAAFVHFRVPSTSQYFARRDRQRTFMDTKLPAIGIAQTYYFFTRLSHQDEHTFQRLLSSNANPYLAVTDSRMEREVIPGPIRFCYFAVLSRRGEEGRIARFQHRESPNSLYKILSKQRSCEVVFLVPSGDNSDGLFWDEFDQMNDILIVPSAATALVKFLLAFFSRFMFNFIFLASDLVKIDNHEFSIAMTNLADKRMKVFVGGSIRGISRDLLYILSSPMMLRNLDSTDTTLSIFDLIDRYISIFTTVTVPLKSVSLA